MAGILYACACYLAWGVLPLYFHQLERYPPLMILAHRILWCVAFLGLYLISKGQFRNYLSKLRDFALLRILTISSLLIGLNWYLFVFAVSEKRVSEVALAYYVSPLLSALIGTTYLGEQLRGPQYFSIALAFVGVGGLAWERGGVPWLAVTIAISFALYGMIRKRVQVDSLLALWIETLLLSLPALVVAVTSTPKGLTIGDWGLLGLAGPLTGLPLLWFGQAAVRLRLVTLGLMQYISPTLQFFIAVVCFEESLRRSQILAFGCIWLAVALYSYSSVRSSTPNA